MTLKLLLSIKTTIILSALVFLAGCAKEEAEYVEVEEVQQQAPAAVDPHAGHNHPPGEHPEAPEPGLGFSYDVPAGWSVQPPSSMVLLSLQAGSEMELPASLGVSAFPGDVGGQLANINRWRRQVGLGPVSPEAAESFVTNMKVSGMDAWQVDFTGPEAVGGHGGAPRVVVTALPYEGQTWFFKLMGPDAAVGAELEDYKAFLESVKF